MTANTRTLATNRVQPPCPPHGRYAYIPLIAGALDRDNEQRTRGP